jgi:prepilin-type N-terminal cleavage/methylation domain-containing protein
MPIPNPQSQIPNLPHPPRLCASAGNPSRFVFSAFPLSAFSSSAINHPPSAIRRAAAFTLIELLVVIAVIAILAGLTLAAMGGIQKRGARAKAESDIQALSAAIEEYRRDFGVFPPANSNALYAELTSDANAGYSPSNTSKVYLEVPVGIIGTNGSQKFFQDPWGVAYEYTTNAAGFFEILSRAGSTSSNTWIRN